MTKNKIIVSALAVGLVSSLSLSTLAIANGFSMSLTGTPSLNQTMTIQFNNGVVPTGTYFDIFMCPDQTVVPTDDGDSGDCQVVTFWDRSDVENYGYLQDQDPVYSMKWVLSTGPTNALRLNGEPYLDSDGEPLLVFPPGYDEDEPEVFGGWCQFDGWFFSVNDFQGGNNSNWSSAFDAAGCNSAPADLTAAPATTSPTLATTGANVGFLALSRRKRIW
jgi:hypothetical protein